MSEEIGGPVEEVDVRMSWPRRVRTISFAALTTTKALYSHQVRLLGWALLETTGTAAAEIDILNGQSASSDLVAPIALSSGQSTRDWLGPQGITCDAGLFLSVGSGSVRGALWVEIPT